MVPCRIQNWTECDRCVGRGDMIYVGPILRVC